jgi:hypothetical protein
MRTLRQLLGLCLGVLLIGATAMAVPMHGTYTIGDGVPADSFTSFTAAVSALTTNGVDGAVIFKVEEGITYSSGSVAITQITGASATNTITFRDAVPGGTRPLISANATPAVNLNGADYITFDGIDITLTVAGKVVQITADANYNTIKNCTLTGTSETSSSNYGVYTTGGGNDYNVIDSVTVNHTIYYPVYLGGATATSDVGNEVRNCTLIGGMYGVYLTRQNGTMVHDCDIQPGYGSSLAYGIYCSTQTAGQLCTAYGNKIHNIRSSSLTYAVNANPGTGGLFKAYNNFVYDFVLTGTSAVYALYAASGSLEFYFNSVYIGDVGTTGNVYGFYQTGTSTETYLKNNVLQVNEPTNNCWSVYANQGTLYSDYNAFYSAGPGAHYNMGYSGSSYANLVAWQLGTGSDLNSVEGNPGFVSATDLHIQPHYSLLNGIGLGTAGITTDIDGDLRGSPPDIGADEYAFTPMVHDYGVNKWVGIIDPYPAGTPVLIQAVVKNYGTNAETDVPVVLYYNNLSQDTVLLSLASGAKDTVELDWTAPVPAGDQEFGTLMVTASCPSDTFTQNDTLKTTVRTTDPMAGTYDIGGGANNYATIVAAVTALNIRGVDGPVTFNVYETTYSGTVTIGSILGASAINTITFRDAGMFRTPPVIAGNVILNGADYVTFDGINITNTGSGNCVLLEYGADYNTIKNCLLTSGGETSSLSYGVDVEYGDNDYNVIENVTISHSAYYLVYLNGAEGSPDSGNVVRNCTLIGGRTGVSLFYQTGAAVNDCDLQPGYDAATGNIYGIMCNFSTGAQFYRNKIHNFHGSCTSIYGPTGIELNVYNVSATVYNNFVYDYVVTGPGTVRGIRVDAGTANLYFNSVYIGDVASTGPVYGFYEFVQDSPTTVIMKNNVFRVEEQQNPSRAIYVYDGTLTSDYNCFYGSGDDYAVGYLRSSASTYATLADWQIGTGQDLNSVEGDPGFVSPTDLHIQPQYSLLNGTGIAAGGIISDIDGDGRGSPPDIGADEYAHTALAHDYGVNKWVGWMYSYSANTPVVIQAEVKNYGTNAETNVPVVLIYQGVPQDTALVSLTPGQKDTVDLDWTPPNLSVQYGTLVVKAFCPSDTFAGNDSLKAQVQVQGGPMSGVFNVGGGDPMDFATISQAVSALALVGVSGPVTFNVYPLTYTGSIRIYAIPGASATNTITFRAAPTHLDTPPKIVSSGTYTYALTLTGADYVTFDGIDLQDLNSGEVVSIAGGADYNTIKNCTVTGQGQTGTGNYGIRVGGGGNDYNVFENVTVNRTVYYPIYLQGNSSTRDQGNEVRNCTLIGGRYGVWFTYQNGAMVHDCDIQPGYDGATVEIAGIFDDAQAAGELSTAYGNQIHNIRGSRVNNAIDAAPGSGGLFRAYNNFVYDFEVNVTSSSYYSYVLRAVSGTVEFYYNSVSIGDVVTSSKIYGFYGATTAVLKNNIFRIAEPTATCYAIYRSGGTLTSDYNCVYGTGTGYKMGYSGADYTTLALWQAGTVYDDHSVEGDPGFVSATNLHIDSTYVLVSEAGTPITGITVDIDGDARDTLRPDIGADEYIPAGHDFGVVGFVGLLPEYVYQTPYTIQADVQNNGIFNETDVPVRLYYAGVLQSTTLVTLNAGMRDTIDLAWTTPDTNYEVDTLKAQAFCPNDGVPANNSAVASVTVVGPPEAVDSLTIYQDVAAGDVLLRWAPAARANSYKVYRGTVYGFVVDGTTYIGQTTSTTYTDVGVLATAGAKYYVVIASTDIIARGR